MSDLYTQLGDGIIAATPGIVAGLSPIPERCDSTPKRARPTSGQSPRPSRKS